MTALDYIIKAINASLDSEKIILFGSMARNTTVAKDADVAVIQKSTPKLGQKAEVLIALEKLGYNWSVDPDIHIFSEDDFNERLKENDLFVTEISKGKVIYAK